MTYFHMSLDMKKEKPRIESYKFYWGGIANFKVLVPI